MTSEKSDNSGKIWGLAAIVGVLAFLILKFSVDYAFWPALFLAILIGILVAILIWVGFYRDAEIAAVTPAASAPTPVRESEPAKAAPASPEKAAPTAKTATKKPAKKPAAKKPTAKPATKTATKSTAKKTAPKTARTPVAKDGKPPVLAKARDAGADDLKKIKGVGPGLEKTLNELGFYHFDQVAAWRKKETEWVDERLRFKGRIVRDDWVKQCKAYAKGEAYKG